MTDQTTWLWVPLSVAMLLDLSSCTSGKAKADAGEGKAKAVPVMVASVQSRDVRRTVEAVGTLYAYDEAVVSSEVDGRAVNVLVDVGDHVSKGQVMVEILPIEYKLASDQQEAVVQEARAKLGLAPGQTELKSPTDAASVKKAAADLANAKQKFERTKALADQGLVPKQQYDADEADYQAAQADYDLAVEDVENLEASLKEQSALRDLAAKKLHDTQILAPFDGFVKERDVTVGQYLKAPSPAMVLVHVDPIRVRLKIPEKMAGWVPVGQPVSVSVDAYPDRTFTGKITRINPSVDPTTRTFDAEALVENHDRLLKPGFFVKAIVDSTKVDHILYIPQNALSYAYGIYTVFEIGKGNKLKQQEVKLGDRLDTDVELLSGAAEGDRLAIGTPGQELAMKDGVQVKVVTGEKGGKGQKGQKGQKKGTDASAGSEGKSGGSGGDANSGSSNDSSAS